VSSPDTPATPDYKGAAEATAAGSQATTAQQNYANRPTINTPWGTQTWNTSAATDPSTGLPVTQWQQNIQLNPQQQQALDAQTAITTARSNAATSLLPQIVRNFSGGSAAVDYGGYNGGRYGVGFGAGANDWQSGRPEMAAPRPNMAVAPAPRGGAESSSYGNQLPPPVFEGPQAGRSVTPTTTAGPSFGGSATSFGSSAPASGGITVDPNYWRAAGQGAALGFQAPLQQQRQQQLETQLSNMGLTRGSESWRNEIRNLQDQNARDNLQAFGAGQSEAGQLFNQAMQANSQGLAAQNQNFSQGLAGANFGLQQQNQAFGQDLSAQGFNQQLRQQQIAEMLQARSQPLNELNALLSGQQVGMPQMPGFNTAGKAQGVDYTGVANNQYGAAQNAANAQNAASASNTQAGISAAMMAAMMFSDERLKEGIVKVGQLPNGINLYKYNFIGHPLTELGVLAQEVQKIMPEAVKEHENGYLMVNYNMVLA
jgi:hypothetical protein